MHPVIALDGPSASGKSSVGQALAQRLGFIFVSTGPLYRAITWGAFRNHAFPDQGDAGVEAWLKKNPLRFSINPSKQATELLLEGEDPTPFLRGPEVLAHLPAVSAMPAVREYLLSLQRDLATAAPLVMEGRDIGTVIFPQTPYKFFLDADPAVREARRSAQGEVDNVRRRDQLDSTRKAAPLVRAPDAMLIDSTHLSFEQTLHAILDALERKGLSAATTKNP